MSRSEWHAGAFGLIVIAAIAIAFGPPSAPIWVRWSGCILALPALALFILTAPRSRP